MGERWRKRGEAGVRQGNRTGVLIKKRQIAEEQIISFFPDIRQWWVDTRMPETFASNCAELICLMQAKRRAVIISEAGPLVRGCKCLAEESLSCSRISVSMKLNLPFRIRLKHRIKVHEQPCGLAQTLQIDDVSWTSAAVSVKFWRLCKSLCI